MKKKSHRPEIPPKPRAVFLPLAFLFLMVLALGVTTSLSAADQGRGASIHRFHLQRGLAGLIDSGGGLVFLPEGARAPLLETELVSPTGSRRRREGDLFHAEVTEGVQGGHRGFSSRADDDQDGRTDEDPLDGIDNDQDGNIDEDFAAVGDAMVAVHLRDSGKSGQGAQLEYYHWASSHLGSAVFLSAGRSGARTGGRTYSIYTSGSGWVETGTQSLRHSAAGRPEDDGLEAFVSQVLIDDRSLPAAPCTYGTSLWLGVMILKEDSPIRFRPENNRLDLPLGETPVPLVICAADSWLQLNRILGEARAVFEGMTDPVDNRRVRWIEPPACSACRMAAPPDFDLQTESDGSVTLIANIAPGQCGLLDPDLFQVGHDPLGAPREIRWLPAGGRESVVSWNCLTSELLRDGASASALAYPLFAGLSGHEAQGTLEFVFDPPPNVSLEKAALESAAAGELVGRFLNGRVLRSTLAGEPEEGADIRPDLTVAHDPEPSAVEEVARGYAEDRARLLETDRNHLSLSPDLLIGWPNPFNDNISIRFTVPRTMKEAFVWKNKQNQPGEVELEGDVPWPGGQPGVSVKIYSINGQELVTLHSATQGAGEYTVQWNGTDAFGRKVASGTYFCKLQMDDWSVTRRLVFLR